MKCQVCFKEISESEAVEHQGMMKCPRCKNEYETAQREDAEQNKTKDMYREFNRKTVA